MKIPDFVEISLDELPKGSDLIGEKIRVRFSRYHYRFHDFKIISRRVTDGMLKRLELERVKPNDKA